MDALHSQYEAALKDWQSKYERSERDLAEVSGADSDNDDQTDDIKMIGENEPTQHDGHGERAGQTQGRPGRCQQGEAPKCRMMIMTREYRRETLRPCGPVT